MLGSLPCACGVLLLYRLRRGLIYNIGKKTVSRRSKRKQPLNVLSIWHYRTWNWAPIMHRNYRTRSSIPLRFNAWSIWINWWNQRTAQGGIAFFTVAKRRMASRTSSRLEEGSKQKFIMEGWLKPYIDQIKTTVTRGWNMIYPRNTVVFYSIQLKVNQKVWQSPR